MRSYKMPLEVCKNDPHFYPISCWGQTKGTNMAIIYFDTVIHDVFETNSSCEIQIDPKERSFYFTGHRANVIGFLAVCQGQRVFIIHNKKNITPPRKLMVVVYDLEDEVWEQILTGDFQEIHMKYLGKAVLDYS
jgi:hypothetical protein